MLTEKIKHEVARLKAKYQTDDPFDLCDAMHITLLLLPMGTDDDACKGFFIINARRKVIALNSELDEFIQRIILAHELGHASLHTSQAICTFHDFAMFDEKNRLEYEANIFASELLLADERVMDAMKIGDMDFFNLSRYLNVPPELLDFKLRIMQKQGYPISAPYIAQSTFLKRNLSQPLM